MQTKAYAEINKDDCIQYWRKRVEILIHAYIYSGFLSGTMIKYYFQRKFWGRQGLFLLQLQIIEGSEGRNFWAGLFWVPHSITPEQWTYFTAIDIQQKAWRILLTGQSWTRLYFPTQLLCDTIPRETSTNIYSPQMGNGQQTKVRDHGSPS